MNTIRLQEATKKKPTKKMAQSVYHRDYLRTRNKPYRKYKPEDETETSLTEGPLDFARGAASEVGRRIGGMMTDVSTAGKTASAMSDIKRQVSRLLTTLATYDRLKRAEDAQQQRQQQRQQQSEKQTMHPGQYDPEYVFSSEFANLASGNVLEEGSWDYIKGATGAIAKHISDKLAQRFLRLPDALEKAHVAGRAASAAGDMTKQRRQLEDVKGQITQIVRQLVSLSDELTKLGQDGDGVVEKIANQLTSGSGPRILQLMQRSRHLAQQRVEPTM